MLSRAASTLFRAAPRRAVGAASRRYISSTTTRRASATAAADDEGDAILGVLEGRTIQRGDFVSLHHKVTSTCGAVKLDTTDVAPGNQDKDKVTAEPMRVLVGSGAVLPIIERALLESVLPHAADVAASVKAGVPVRSLAVTVKPGNDGYGHRDETLVKTITANEMPEEVREQLRVGMMVRSQDGSIAAVTEISEENGAVTFDANHPMAGKELLYNVDVMDHVPAAEVPEDQRLIVPDEGTAEDGGDGPRMLLDCAGGLVEAQDGAGKLFPRTGDLCAVHYVGRLAKDGTVFDSSRERKKPFQFVLGVGQVIRGWDEGVMQMSEGQRSLLRVPAAKAYGDQAVGELIPAGADLEFDVELIAVTPGRRNHILEMNR